MSSDLAAEGAAGALDADGAAAPAAPLLALEATETELMSEPEPKSLSLSLLSPRVSFLSLPISPDFFRFSPVTHSLWVDLVDRGRRKNAPPTFVNFPSFFSYLPDSLLPVDILSMEVVSLSSLLMFMASLEYPLSDPNGSIPPRSLVMLWVLTWKTRSKWD